MKGKEVYAFLCLLCFAYVYGATFKSNIGIKIVNGRVVPFCQHGNIRVSPGTEFEDYDMCTHCTCSYNGLDCQTLGSAGRITVPNNTACISKLIDCHNHWVLRNDNSKDCPPNLIPTENISMTGK
ncbi:uncharacterized protein LOC123564477 [Mercenaria mercenaria]|uniref:uncharacterized protein LOC123564477 n=1 Tax=Mercenaria mercenaria TaxID=6596 RepID=UPI00234FB238|nr:uncharacterized protein LOC123564477 [Mercenaria mercenaria]